MIADDKKRGIDDPELNQDASTYDKDESFDDSDDFHKYDDTQNSNVNQDDAIAQSNDSVNTNARNHTPTFTRTYDKNASGEVDRSGRYDGEINV